MSQPPQNTGGTPTLPPWLEKLRGPFLFLGGAAGMVFETAFASEKSTVLILAFLAMLGFPAFGLIDRALRQSSPSEPASSSPPAKDDAK